MGEVSPERYRPLRICVTGADSESNTQLSNQLGRVLRIPVVGRSPIGEPSDISRVVEQQALAEDRASREAVLLVLDTDVFSIAIRESMRMGRRFTEIENLATYRQSSAKKVDFYLLASPEGRTPAQTGERDSAWRLHDAFARALEASGRRFAHVDGGSQSRCGRALHEIQRFLLEQAAAGSAHEARSPVAR